jgi:hypothetical protein
MPFDPPLPPDALAALQQGRTIEAIKIVRAAEGLGLKEAKDRVDRCVASDPALRERQGTRASRGCLLLLAGVALLAGAGLFVSFRSRG